MDIIGVRNDKIFVLERNNFASDSIRTTTDVYSLRIDFAEKWFYTLCPVFINKIGIESLFKSKVFSKPNLPSSKDKYVNIKLFSFSVYSIFYSESVFPI